MSYDVLSDEVATDFLESLKDLQLNVRWEISNLTIIAKENTEHALAISEALKLHIKQVGGAHSCMDTPSPLLLHASLTHMSFNY